MYHLARYCLSGQSDIYVGKRPCAETNHQAAGRKSGVLQTGIRRQGNENGNKAIACCQLFVRERFNNFPSKIPMPIEVIIFHNEWFVLLVLWVDRKNREKHYFFCMISL